MNDNTSLSDGNKNEDGENASIFSKDDYLKAIGQLTVNMSNLEQQVKNAIGWLIGHDYFLNRGITAGMYFKDLLKLFNTLFRIVISDKDRLGELKDLIKDLDEIGDERNRYIHRQWLFLGDDKSPIVVSTKLTKNLSKELNEDKETPSLKDLNVLSDKIEGLIGRVFRLLSLCAGEMNDYRKIIEAINSNSPLNLVTQEFVRKIAERAYDSSRTPKQK